LAGRISSVTNVDLSRINKCLELVYVCAKPGWEVCGCANDPS